MKSSKPEPLRFDEDDLGASLDRLSDAEIDQLSFGVLLVNSQGEVKKYSGVEAEQSGYGHGRSPVGCDFFAELAPCMDTPDFRGRIEAARQKGTVDIEFGHTGDYSDRSRHFRIRVISSWRYDGFWHVHDRNG